MQSTNRLQLATTHARGTRGSPHDHQLRPRPVRDALRPAHVIKQAVVPQDALGSTIALTDTSGSIVRSYTYDPDGNPNTSEGGATTSLQHDGGHQIAGLDHFAARYYDRGIARWTQHDPINQLTSFAEATGTATWAPIP